MGAADTLAFIDQGTETFTSAKITLAPLADFQDYLDAATAGNATATAHGHFEWFQFNGNTYLVQDNDAAANTFNNGTDIVVELVGEIDLSGTAAGSENFLLV